MILPYAYLFTDSKIRVQETEQKNGTEVADLPLGLVFVIIYKYVGSDLHSCIHDKTHQLFKNI